MKGRSDFADWRKGEFDVIAGLMKDKGIEVEQGTGRTEHFNTREFKQYTSQLAELKQEALTIQSSITNMQSSLSDAQKSLSDTQTSLSKALTTKKQVERSYQAKKAYIERMDKISDVSMMYPDWVRPNKLNKNEVIVPKDKWEAKHISSMEKSALKSQQKALEKQMEEFYSSTQGEYVTSLETHVQALEKENHDYKWKNLNLTSQNNELSKQVGDLKWYQSMYHQLLLGLKTLNHEGLQMVMSWFTDNIRKHFEPDMENLQEKESHSMER